MDLETFNKWSATYEASTGGVTRQVATHIVRSHVFPSLTSSSVILDNAAGPGIVTEEILKLGPPADVIPIHVVDVSPPMVEIATALFASRGGSKNVKCAVMPGEELGFPDGTFTHSVTNIGILVFQDGEKGAREIYRTLKASSDHNSSVAVVTSWQFLGFAGAMREACLKVRPGEEPFSLPIDKAWFDLAHLEKIMRDAGFGDDVEMSSAEFAMGVDSLPLLFGAFEPEMRKALVGWSDEEFARYKEEFVRMGEETATVMKGVADEIEKKALPMRASIAVCRK